MASPTYPGTGISAVQRATFDREGYLIIRDVFRPGEIRALLEASDRAEQRWLADPDRIGTDDHFLRRVEPLIEYDDAFVELLDHPGFFPVVRELLGDSIAMIDTSYFVTPSGQGWGGTSEWHIDEALTGPVGAAIPLMVKACVPLVDIMDIDDGPTAVIPGSHVRSYEENLPAPQDPRDMMGKVPVLLSAGDVYIFHGRIYHAAMPNVGGRTRRVLHYNYGHIWMKPWPGYDPSERLRRSACSAIRKQLLHISHHHYQDRLTNVTQ